MAENKYLEYFMVDVFSKVAFQFNDLALDRTDGIDLLNFINFRNDSIAVFGKSQDEAQDKTKFFLRFF